MRLGPRLYPALALLALAARTPSSGADFLVDRFDDAPGAASCTLVNPNDCSLRGAVRLANTTVAADQILLPDGVYQLTVPGAMEDLANTGDLDVLANLTVRAVIGTHPTIVQTTADRIFHADPAIDFLGFEGPMTLQGGFGAGNGVGRGGSILVDGAHTSLSLNQVALSGATAEGRGGCVYFGNSTTGGVLTVSDVTITACSAGTFGGGLAIQGGDPEVSLLRVLVEGCHAAQRGGGIFVSALPSLGLVKDSIVRGNTAGDASHVGHGGGLRLENGAQVRLDSTSVVGNSAGAESNPNGGAGGGVDLTSSLLELRNATISGNRTYGAFAPSPGVEVSSSTLDLDHATIANNAPGPASPPFRSIRLTNGTLVVEASIVEGGCEEATLSTMTSQGYNVERPTDGSMVTECDLADPSDVLTTATVVRPLAGNGGPTPTHALAPGSPAQLLVPSGTCAALDQRHAPRSLLFCDAGSYESSGHPTGQWIFSDGYESGDSFAWSDDTP
jgi:hypothetical protein